MKIMKKLAVGIIDDATVGGVIGNQVGKDR